MPFFLKPCIKFRKKKKKTAKKNSSMYFKFYLDKESPVPSEAIQASTSTSFASIDRDEKDIGLLTKLILESPESQTENAEENKSGKTEDISEVSSPDRDILDIVSSAVEQLSEENGSSDDNRYLILSSSLRQDQETHNAEFRGLLNESFETPDDKLNDVKEKQPCDIFMKNVGEDCNNSELANNEFILADRVIGIYMAEHEASVEVVKALPVKECSSYLTSFVSKHHNITEREHLLPLTIKDHFIEQKGSFICEKENVCDKLQNIATDEISAIDVISTPYKEYLGAERTLSLEETLAINANSKQQEEKEEMTTNHFSNFELSLMIQKVLIPCFCENEFGNVSKIISTDDRRETFDTGNYEMTGASKIQEIEEIQNPAESINHSFGDNRPELLQIRSDVTENNIINNAVVDEPDIPKLTDEMTSSTISECIGDHSANVSNRNTKGLSCRMAAVLNVLPSTVLGNETNLNQRAKSYSGNARPINKRRRSRNVLIRSLDINLSPEQFKREINVDHLCSEEKLKQKCVNSLVEKGTCKDIALQVIDLKSLCGKMEKKEAIVSHAVISNNTESFCAEQINYKKMDNTDLSPFPQSILNRESNCKNMNAINTNTIEKLRNYSAESINDSSVIHKFKKAFDVSEKTQMRSLQVIKKILSFAEREVNLFRQNAEYQPKNLKDFMKEILFDYKFYEGPKIHKLTKKQLRFKIAEKSMVIPDENKLMFSTNRERESFETESKDDGKEHKEIYEFSNQKFDINCQNIDFFNIYFDIPKCKSEMSTNFTEFYDRKILSKEENEINVSTDITINDTRFDNDKNSETLDECLAFEEQLKCQNKTRNPKSILTPETSEIENKDLEDDFSFEILHNCDENFRCFEKISEYSNVDSPLNDFRSFEFDDIEKCKILESPSLVSGGGDIGKKSVLFQNQLKLFDNEHINLDINKGTVFSEKIVTPDEITKTNMSESNDAKSVQDFQNQLTIVLSPRKNSALVNCSVNMTLGENSTSSVSLTSPISIQVTREDMRNKEAFSSKASEDGSKCSAKDISEFDCLHRPPLFDSEEIENKRLRNIELYELNKSEAMKPMGKQTRIIPIHHAGSFEFTLSNHDKSVRSKKISVNHSSKSRRNGAPRVVTPHHIGYKTFRTIDYDVNSYSSSNISSLHESDIEQAKIPISKNFRNRYDSPSSPIYRTPMRRKILTASQAIRSPKFSLQNEPSPLKEIRSPNSSPHKIGFNYPKHYFSDESSSEYNHEHERQGSEKSMPFDGCQTDFNSHINSYGQRLVWSKVESPTDLSSRFDLKFKRYARKGRTTGDLISYKRSTQWMKDAGIVGKTLTSEEADRAFKCAAGVKVALNKSDYRRFLKKLSRLKRLRYIEIYKQLSEAVSNLAK